MSGRLPRLYSSNVQTWAGKLRKAGVSTTHGFLGMHGIRRQNGGPSPSDLPGKALQVLRSIHRPDWL